MNEQTGTFPALSAVNPQKIFVVFSGFSELKSVRFLKQGYKHCYVLMHDGTRWITCDPLAHMTEIAVHELPANFNLPSWLRARGQKVIEAVVEPAPLRPAPLMPMTCVEAVKRVLGIHKRTILTPYQLYKFLNSKHISEER